MNDIKLPTLTSEKKKKKPAEKTGKFEGKFAAHQTEHITKSSEIKKYSDGVIFTKCWQQKTKVNQLQMNETGNYTLFRYYFFRASAMKDRSGESSIHIRGLDVWIFLFSFNSF